ncbi:MAG: hypothetical protein HQK49_09520 [Oligoflexia bacterium]|nr:hypothetical protein [Oligoflexia bacterium]
MKILSLSLLSLAIVLVFLILLDAYARDANSAGDSGGSGGGMISTGIDGYTTELNPFFIGCEEVKYCIVINEDDFSRKVNDVKNDIANAISDWKNAIEIIKPKPIPENTSLVPKRFVGKNISTNFKFESNCNKNTDLIFLIGEINQDVRKVLSERAKHVLAFTKKNKYSEESGRAQGFIWVAPDRGKNKYNLPGTLVDFWQKTSTSTNSSTNSTPINYNFYNVITHELGHVFGIHHDEYTTRLISRLSTTYGPKKESLESMVYRNLWRVGNIRCGRIRTLDNSLRKIIGIANDIGFRNGNSAIICIKTFADENGVDVSIGTDRGRGMGRGPLAIKFFQTDTRVELSERTIKPLIVNNNKFQVMLTNNMPAPSPKVISNNEIQSSGFYNDLSSSNRSEQIGKYHQFFTSLNYTFLRNLKWVFYDSDGKEVNNLPVQIRLSTLHRLSNLSITAVFNNDFVSLETYLIGGEEVIELEKELEDTW